MPGVITAVRGSFWCQAKNQIDSWWI